MKHGALVGLVVGVALAVVGEAGAAITRSTAYVADVGILGSTPVYGLPASVVLGALLGWWGPTPYDVGRFAVAGPVGLVTITQVARQALSV